MHTPNPIVRAILNRDPRYTWQAYEFVEAALQYTIEHLATPSPSRKGKHVSGPELLEGVRQLALDQFGFMARTTLNRWGVRSTADVGSIVFNMVEHGHWDKTPDDRLEDFAAVYEFETAFDRSFEFQAADAAEEDA